MSDRARFEVQITVQEFREMKQVDDDLFAGKLAVSDADKRYEDILGSDRKAVATLAYESGTTIQYIVTDRIR